MTGPVGSEKTRLIVLRGNSGSGKTTTAKRIREAYGRGIAIVGQDTARRTILHETGPVWATLGLVDTMARYCLDQGYHVILDGIFSSGRWAP
ncbi:AAA family ATPase [Streptomyces olivoreticuli]